MVFPRPLFPIGIRSLLAISGLRCRNSSARICSCQLLTTLRRTVKRSVPTARFFKLSATTSIATVRTGQSTSPLSNLRSTPLSVPPPTKPPSKSSTDISLVSSRLFFMTTPRPQPWILSKRACSTISKRTMPLLQQRQNSPSTPTVAESTLRNLISSISVTMFSVSRTSSPRTTSQLGSSFTLGLDRTKSLGTTRLERRLNSTLARKRPIRFFTERNSNSIPVNLRILNVVLAFPSPSMSTTSKSLRFSVIALNSTKVCNFCVSSRITVSKMPPTAMPTTSSNQHHVFSSPSTSAVSPIFLRISKHGLWSAPGPWIRQVDLRLRRLDPLHLAQSPHLWRLGFNLPGSHLGILRLDVHTVDLLRHVQNLSPVDATSTSSAWVLGGMEEGTLVKDFEVLGVGDSSIGGGCRDYFNLDCSSPAIVDAFGSAIASFFFVF